MSLIQTLLDSSVFLSFSFTNEKVKVIGWAFQYHDRMVDLECSCRCLDACQFSVQLSSRHRLHFYKTMLPNDVII